MQKRMLLVAVVLAGFGGSKSYAGTYVLDGTAAGFDQGPTLELAFGGYGEDGGAGTLTDFESGPQTTIWKWSPSAANPWEVGVEASIAAVGTWDAGDVKVKSLGNYNHAYGSASYSGSLSTDMGSVAFAGYSGGISVHSDVNEGEKVGHIPGSATGGVTRTLPATPFMIHNNATQRDEYFVVGTLEGGIHNRTYDFTAETPGSFAKVTLPALHIQVLSITATP